MDTLRRLETQNVLAGTAGVSVDNADAVSRIVVEPWDELHLGQFAEVIITLDTMLNALLTRERIFILHSSSDLGESEMNPSSVSYPTSAQSVRLERVGFITLACSIEQCPKCHGQLVFCLCEGREDYRSLTTQVYWTRLSRGGDDSVVNGT